MPRLKREVFQSRLESTWELLDSLALLSDETLRQVRLTAIPKELLCDYAKLVGNLHTLAEDAERLAEAASRLTAAHSVTLQ